MKKFLHSLTTTPNNINFQDSIAIIDTHYNFTHTAFRNGELKNEAGQNNGSCKLFSFAKLHKLTPQQTLQCFGAYYREDVLQHPHSSDHQNIRNFIQYGWEGVVFQGDALELIAV